MTDSTLSNVIADAFAHHEASDLESVVHIELEERPVAWLDFERAGRIAAQALIEVPAPDGWTGPTPLFSVRNTSTVGPPPSTVDDERTGAAADNAPHALSAAADPSPGPSDPPLGPGERRTIGHLLGLARQVMPIDAQRQRFLTNQLRELGLDTATLGALHQLTVPQIDRIMERLAIYGEAAHRMKPTRPVSA